MVCSRPSATALVDLCSARFEDVVLNDDLLGVAVAPCGHLHAGSGLAAADGSRDDGGGGRHTADTPRPARRVPALRLDLVDGLVELLAHFRGVGVDLLLVGPRGPF